MDLDDVRRSSSEILGRLSRVVVGYREEQRLLLASMLANGHVLLEGVPGIAKTTMVKAIARLMGLTDEYVELGGIRFRGFSRIQFTPDLLPSDITGSLIFNPSTRSFEPRLGPVFAYIVLADEINRAVPRTQSALLEAMQERQVTIGGTTYPLEDREKGKFFLVVATQNPVEQEGTYPLPEAQLDRFLMRIIMEYPEGLEDEKNVLRLHLGRLTEPYEDLESVVEPGWLVEAQRTVAEQVSVGEDVLDYVTRLVRTTRPSIFKPIARFFELGASPRAGISLIRASQAYAAIRGAGSVEKQDVDSVLFPVLNHRLIPNMDRVIEAEEEDRFHARINVIREGLKLVVEQASG